MKKLLFLLAAVFILTMPSAAFADTFLSEDEIAALEANEDEEPYSVLLNNTGFVTFSAQQPINVGGRVYVPVRGVFENLGYEVDFDVETKTAVLTSSEHQIEITLGNEYFTVDGRYVYPETAQFIMRGSFMIPLRAVAEAIGAEVGYNATSRLITINYQLSTDETSVATRATTTTEAITETTTEAADADEVNVHFTIDGTDYRFGQTRVSTPVKKLSSPYGFTWYVYKPNLNKYYMLGINDEGEIVAFYAQSLNFTFKTLSYGDTSVKNAPNVNGYTVQYYMRNSTNKLYDGKLYALFVCKDEYLEEVTYDYEVLSDIKTQLYDMLSAIRTGEGEGVQDLEISEYTTAQKHTDDLAEGNNQASVSFTQKLTDSGVYLDMPKYDLYETTASSTFYLDLLDRILSNTSAYQAVLYGGYYDIDMGLSYSEDEDLLYYAQNIYISKDDYYDDDYSYR